jgi:xanthine dehydrogenase accessory factor
MGMRDLLSDYRRFVERGEPVGRAVVTDVFGSAPLPPGATLLATAGGTMAGSVSGGCVEAATAEAIRESMQRGRPRERRFGVSDELAWDVGLPCGGTIRLLIEPSIRPELLDAAGGPGGVVLATLLGRNDVSRRSDPDARALQEADPDGGVSGLGLLVREEGRPEGPLLPSWREPNGNQALRRALEGIGPMVATAAREALAKEASGTRTFPIGTGEELEIFLEVFARHPTLVIFGAVHVAVELVPLARRLGYRTVVADGRSAFLTRERFPDADELMHGWPEEAFARIGLDRSTHVCVLTHDPKFDDPAILLALRSPAAYVGAIGSRRAQTARRERLRAAGLTEEELARLRGPIGLDLGGRQPAETALAILGEMTAARYGGSCRPMREQAPGGRELSSRAG